MIGIYEIDLSKGIFLKVSDNVCEGLGYSEEELVGYPVSKVLTKTSMDYFQNRMERMNNGELLDGRAEYIAVAKDGTLIPITIEAFYKIAGGKIIGAIVAAEEIKSG